MNRTAGRFALAFALLGLGSSAAASYVHYRLLSDPSYLSFCDVSALVNCSQVYSSPYGALAGQLSPSCVPHRLERPRHPQQLERAQPGVATSLHLSCAEVSTLRARPYVM